MSKRTRRKTLSHAEIENFLCDLQPEPEVRDLNGDSKSIYASKNDMSLLAKYDSEDIMDQDITSDIVDPANILRLLIPVCFYYIQKISF
jgi:hypothetical protein